MHLEGRSAVAGAKVPSTVYRLRAPDLSLRQVVVADERQLVVPATFEVHDDSDGLVVIGRGIVYEAMSQDLGWFTEIIQRGALRKLLATGPDVRCLFNHDPSVVLGRTSNQTLTLTDGPDALTYEAQPSRDSASAMDAVALIRGGFVSGSSFIFTVERDSWEITEDDEMIRTVLEFSGLWDVGPVTFPAYLQSNSAVRELPGDAPGDAEVVGDVGQQRDGEGGDVPQHAGSAQGSADDDGRKAREVSHREQVAQAKRRRAVATRL